MIVPLVHDCNRLDPAPASPRRAAGRAGLSRDEEVELAARLAGGDHQARNRMVQANLGLVATIAREFRGRGLPMEDLIGEGNLGLMRAADEFDPRFGTRFSTYASYWIKQAIRHALINTTATIRLPAHMVGLMTRWKRAERALVCELGRAPSFDEIASSLELSDARKTMVVRALDARRLRREGSQDDGTAARNIAATTDLHRVDELLESEDSRALARRLMDQLDDRERFIVALRYGLEGEALTLKEIGRRLGVTREWVRKLEIRAMRKLGDECRQGVRRPMPAPSD
jgi:RNA polymerase primary sigma factor